MIIAFVERYTETASHGIRIHLHPGHFELLCDTGERR
jgi:hypothetical protein